MIFKFIVLTRLMDDENLGASIYSGGDVVDLFVDVLGVYVTCFWSVAVYLTVL